MRILIFSAGSGPSDGGTDGGADNGGTESGVDWGNSFSGWFSGLLSGIKEGLANLGNSITSGLKDIVSGITSQASKILTSLSNLGTKIIDGLTGLGTRILDGLTSLGSTLLDGITGLISGVLDALISLGTFIVDGIKALFLPDDDFLDSKISSFRSRFSFADSIMSSASGLINTVTASATAGEKNPPKIVMDLDIRGTTKAVTVIDLSWYAPYKRYGDQVIGGMIWVFFIWRVFVHLPGIISGVSGAADLFSSGSAAAGQQPLDSSKQERLEDKSR